MIVIILPAAEGKIDYGPRVSDVGVGGTWPASERRWNRLRFRCGGSHPPRLELKFSGVISGSGELTIDGVTGTPNSRVSFQQTSNNTNTGNVNITATGRLQLGAGSGAADMIYDGATVTVASGGLFWLGKGTNGSETIGALAGAGTVAAVWGSNTLTVGGNNQSGSFSGVIKNDGATLTLVKTGSGTQTFTGANTYNGGTTIQNGTLAIGGASGTVASQALTIGNSTNSGILVLGDSSNAKSLTFSSLNTSGTGTANAIVAGGNATASTLTINTTATDVYAGVFGGAGTNQNLINLNKAGSGSLELSGGGSVSDVQPDVGTLKISGGTLNVSAGFRNSDWGTARTSTVNQTAGTVTLASNAYYYGSRSSNQAITFNLSGGTFDASATRFNLAWDGGSNPTFTVSSTGLLKVSGLDVANSGSSGGTFNLTGGQITIGSRGIGGANYLGTGTVYNTINFGGGTVASSAAFVGAAGQAITLTGTNGSTTFDTTGGNITLNGALGGAGGLTKAGTGTLTLSGNNSYGSLTTVNAGTLELSGGAAIADAGAVSLANVAGAILKLSADETIGSLAGGGTTGGNVDLQSHKLTVGDANDMTYAGVIGGTGGLLTKMGAGTLTLSGNNSYTGATSINAGILQVNVNNALGTNAAGTTVANGAALKLNGVSYTTAEALSINGTGISGGGALVNAGTSTYAGAVTAATSATINAGAGSLTFTGGLVKNGTTLTLTGGGTININTTGISGSSSGSDLVVDGVIVNQNVANDYNGPTYIRNGGTLNANVANALPTANGRTAVIMDDTGTGSSSLVLAVNQAIASLAGAATSTVNTGSNNDLTIGTTTGTTTFAGTISGGTHGNPNLTKDGGSTLILSGDSTFAGDVIINGGTISIDRVSNLGLRGSERTVTFNNGGTLHATGDMVGD